MAIIDNKDVSLDTIYVTANEDVDIEDQFKHMQCSRQRQTIRIIDVDVNLFNLRSIPSFSQSLTYCLKNLSVSLHYREINYTAVVNILNALPTLKYLCLYSFTIGYEPGIFCKVLILILRVMIFPFAIGFSSISANQIFSSSTSSMSTIREIHIG
jgi:hypothetical protein